MPESFTNITTPDETFIQSTVASKTSSERRLAFTRLYGMDGTTEAINTDATRTNNVWNPGALVT